MKAIFLSGRLTADPEIKTVGEKKSKVANFTIAYNEKDKEIVEYYDVECWDKTADFAEGFLKKGQKVMISGSYQNETYKDKEGNTRHHFRVRAISIEFAG